MNGKPPDAHEAIPWYRWPISLVLGPVLALILPALLGAIGIYALWRTGRQKARLRRNHRYLTWEATMAKSSRGQCLFLWEESLKGHLCRLWCLTADHPCSNDLLQLPTLEQWLQNQPIMVSEPLWNRIYQSCLDLHSGSASLVAIPRNMRADLKHLDMPVRVFPVFWDPELRQQGSDG